MLFGGAAPYYPARRGAAGAAVPRAMAADVASAKRARVHLSPPPPRPAGVPGFEGPEKKFEIASSFTNLFVIIR